MTKKLPKLLILLAIFSILLTVGCRPGRPIQDYHNIALPIAKPLTEAQMQGAITRAATGLGWTVVNTEPGLMQATLRLRAHTAIVDIRYTESDYSILYNTSINLEARDGKIHPNYNSWVNNLKRDISAEISRLQ